MVIVWKSIGFEIQWRLSLSSTASTSRRSNSLSTSQKSKKIDYFLLIIFLKNTNKGKASFISSTFSEYFNFVLKEFFILFMSLTFHKRFNVVIPVDTI